MVSLAIGGIPLFILTTLIGISTLSIQQGIGGIPLAQLSVINGVAWIISIVMIAKGVSEYRKNKIQEKIHQEKIQYQNKLKQDDEIKKLKDKVEELEKDKERKD